MFSVHKKYTQLHMKVSNCVKKSFILVEYLLRFAFHKMLGKWGTGRRTDGHIDRQTDTHRQID